ncbi:MAG: hypothetical protein LBK43_01405 [Treponema sp.]|jgi:hypothetical protein|nr:hypothetical protein [Treponema sp.]
MQLIDKDYKDKFGDIYHRDHSDEYGDYNGIKNIPNNRIVFDRSIIYTDKKFLSNLCKYINHFYENGIQVYLLFPPSDSHFHENARIEIEKIYSAISVFDNIRLLFRPWDVIYADNCFFDTSYHLNYNSAIKHTQYIISKYLEEK